MKKQHLPIFSFLLLLFCYGCSSAPDASWSRLVPDKSPYIIIPQKNATVQSVISSSYAPLLEDVSSSAISLLSETDSVASSSLKLNAIIIYPGAQKKMQTIWITKAPRGYMDRMKKKFYRHFSRNHYHFKGASIQKLHFKNKLYYASKVDGNLLLSESSLGIEDAIRAYNNEDERADLSDVPLKSGHIVLNTPSLDRWGEKLTSVTYHPMIEQALDGTGPALISIKKTGQKQNSEYQFSGTIPFSSNNENHFLQTFSSENAPITLDKYISSNAAAFGLFRHRPSSSIPALRDTLQLDSLLISKKSRFSAFAKQLATKFAVVLYAKSGFLSKGEHLFLRQSSHPDMLRKQLQKWVSGGKIERKGQTYYIRSHALAQLIGSSMCDFNDFYLAIADHVVVISKRKGLAEIVGSDQRRRRTMYYEQSFRKIKKQLPQEISGLFVADKGFNSFITPFLAPQSSLNALTSKFDHMAVSAVLDKKNHNLSFNLKTYRAAKNNNPYEEKWLFPTDTELSGKPVLANIGGSKEDEVVFATKSNKVYGLAADGTVVFEASTQSNQPVGSPVVYDWYGSNQNVILIAAGNKIYGWDDNGKMLPKFPFNLDETITSPLVVDDVNRNGLPDALVATADRKLHVINGRGNDLHGWPVTMNSSMKTKPAAGKLDNMNSIVGFSENAVHAWRTNGAEQNGYPKFLESSLKGSPVIYNDHIIGNAANGNLYATGSGRLFADSLNILKAKSENLQAVNASSGSLTGTPILFKSSKKQSSSQILTMSSGGALFLFNTDGQLAFTQNMGQPAAASFDPFYADINRDGKNDVLALANYGRLYAWGTTGSGKRIYTIPTTAMSHPVVADIDGDGYQELIAHTDEGVRCWTLYGKGK